MAQLPKSGQDTPVAEGGAWKFVERACVVLGAVGTAVAAYYAAATYYDWKPSPAVSRAPLGSPDNLSPLLLAVFVAASAALLVVGGTMIYLRSKYAPAMSAATPAPAAERAGFYEGAHEQLMVFIVEHLQPTIGAQHAVQSRLISFAIPSKNLAILAIRGLEGHNVTPAFVEGVNTLSALSDSPPEFIPVEAMMAAVRAIEISYIPYCAVGALLAKVAGEGVWSDPEFLAERENWRIRHGLMVDAYKPIRQNSRLPLLFRPQRPTQFGQRTISPESLDVRAQH